MRSYYLLQKLLLLLLLYFTFCFLVALFWGIDKPPIEKRVLFADDDDKDEDEDGGGKDNDCWAIFEIFKRTSGV